jgi:hypothetical protein
LAAGFLELVLYRLVSRLGMHLSKLAQQHDWIRVTLKTLASIGFTLLNFTSMLVFLAIVLLLIMKLRSGAIRRADAIVVSAVSLLLLLTIGFLIQPPGMLGAVLYNLLSVVVVMILAWDYLKTHPTWPQRIAVITFLVGLGGWFYYQIMSTGYGMLGVIETPPMVHEINRLGEAFMVLASILVFWGFAALPMWSSNRRQQRRLMTFGTLAGGAFLLLLFLDYLVGLYSPSVADSVRKAGEGIGWIFQMGMGYTFYLPFAFYVAGLLCWSYTVSKLVLQGRPAGYGLGLMFIAGYALQLSHLTLLVVFGLMLLTLDRRPVLAAVADPADRRVRSSTLVEEHVHS